MSKFDKLKNDDFKDVAKKSSEKAVVVMIKRIKNENLFDYKENAEDIEDTADLEESIRQLGFIDPIEVTDYGMPEGQFTILSGHRRRAAGVKQGITVFPCLMRQFANEAEIKNYVLLANSHRDSSKDPLLIAKRYRENKKYLEEQGQTYNFRDEIAKRLNLSPKQADRYNRLLDVIPEVWGLIKSNIVGMSSIIKMSSYKEDEQHEILDMLMDCYNKGLPLSRERCDKIISAYSKGIRKYEEIKENEINKLDSAAKSEYDIDDDNIIHEQIDADDEQQKTNYESNVADYSGESKKENTDDISNKNKYGESREKKDDNQTEQAVPNLPNEFGRFGEIQRTDVKQLNQKEFNIDKNIETIKTSLNEIYNYNIEENAGYALRAIKNIIKTMLKESERISKKYNSKDLFDNDANELIDEIKKYLTT